MKYVFILNGSAGKGKDTFANFCKEFARVFKSSAIIPAKNAAAALFGYEFGDEKNNEQIRKALSDLKSIGIRVNDSALRYFETKLKDFISSDCEIMFFDVREPEEIEKIVKKYPFVNSVLVLNSNIEDVTSNPSDANVEQYKNYTHTIDNSCSEAILRCYAEDFVKLCNQGHFTSIAE